MKLLIEKGANVDAKTNDFNYTPLHFAADRGHKDVIALLVENKANVNVRDKHDDTPCDFVKESGKNYKLQIKTYHPKLFKR